MATVQVLLNVGLFNFMKFDPTSALLVDVGTYEFDTDDPNAAAEVAFRKFNIGDPDSDEDAARYRNHYRARSLSVNDVVVVDGSPLLCAPLGFDRLEGPIDRLIADGDTLAEQLRNAAARVEREAEKEGQEQFGKDTAAFLTRWASDLRQLQN